MNKLKMTLCLLIVGLITIFACIPKVSAYEGYASLNNIDTLLYSTDHEIQLEVSLDLDGNSFGLLNFDYTYRLIDDIPHLYIFRYTFMANGYSYNETIDIKIPLGDDVFDLIDVESQDLSYINNMYNILKSHTLYISLWFEEGENLRVYPTFNIHDVDFYYVDYEGQLDYFDGTGYYVPNIFVYDIELDLIHTRLLYETYVINKYRLDGNTLAQIEDISISDWLISSISGFIDTPLLGGVSIGDIIMIILSIGLLFLFLRFFAGG